MQGDFSLVDKDELAVALGEARVEGREVFSFDEASRFPVAEDLQKLVQYRQSSARLLAETFASRSLEEQEAIIKTPAQPFYLRDPHITLSKRKSLLERS